MGHPNIPVVMTFAGHDPTGGAGLQADIEAIVSMGSHAAPVATAVTVQDTRGLQHFEALSPTLVMEQARAVLEDMPVEAFKLGMLGSVANVEVIHTVLRDYPNVPVVLDPVLSAGGGGELGESGVADALLELIFPLATVVTPNSDEAFRLAPGADTLDACAQELLARGCELLLITGTHAATPTVDNTLYGNLRRLEVFSWERLPHSYHGSGCTLASAIAGLLAQGLEPFTAIHEAQEFTWESLRQAQRFGMGQHIPNRLFWAREEEETPQ